MLRLNMKYELNQRVWERSVLQVVVSMLLQVKFHPNLFENRSLKSEALSTV